MPAAISLPVAITGVRAATQSLGSFGRSIGAFAAKLPLLQFAAAAVGADLFTGSVRAAALQMAELHRRADQIGATAGELDRFTRTARALAGVQFDRSIDALETFQERIGEAAFEPDSQIATLFARIGLQVRDADGAVRGTLPVWRDFVTLVGGADKATRNFLAAEFGDVVRDIAIPLSRAADEAARYEARLRALANVDAELARRAADANTEYEFLADTLGAVGTNAGNFIADLLAPFAAYAGIRVGLVNQALFGEAGGVDYESVDEARQSLDALRARLAEIDDDLAAVSPARRGANVQLAEAGGFDAADVREYRAELRAAKDDTEALIEATLRFLGETGETGGIANNQYVSELTRQFNLATTNAAALADEIDRLRADGGDPGLIRFLEQQLKSLRAQRETKDVETDRLLLQERLVGLSGEDAKLAELRHRLARETDAEEQARLRARIEIVERIQAGKQALEEQQAVDAAIADLTLRIERAHHGIEDALLDELGVTRRMLADNAALAALFDALLARRRDLADAAREEAVFGDLNRALDEERARAAGIDVRLHRHLADLQRQGVAYGQQDLERLREELALLDELAFANDLRDDLRGSVADGLRDGLRDFAEGGDIGDVFDAIGRRLSSLLLDLAIGGFGQGGAGGTGLLGGLFGGRRERGGPVLPGRAYVVGEERAELLIPSTAGTILPYVPQAAPRVVQHIRVQGSVRSDADVAAIAQRVAQQSAAGIATAIRHGRLAEA